MSASVFSQLAKHTVVRFSGPDTRAFLQGQLSNDIDALAATGWQWSGFHLPDGRVFALLLLIRAGDDVIACLPASIVESVVTRLEQYRLRARVNIEAVPWNVFGLDREGDADKPNTLAAAVTDRLSILVGPADVAPEELAGLEEADEPHWDLQRIRAGIPFVGSEIQGRYVGQMLNLDLLPAISFSKGCFSGQEILARTQNLGRIKRRSFRFRCASRCHIGDKLLAGDQIVGEVIDSATSNGEFECLAVVRISAIGNKLTIDNQPAERLELPYASV